jgi:hypothetical protein
VAYAAGGGRRTVTRYGRSKANRAVDGIDEAIETSWAHAKNLCFSLVAGGAPPVCNVLSTDLDWHFHFPGGVDTPRYGMGIVALLASIILDRNIPVGTAFYGVSSWG